MKRIIFIFAIIFPLFVLSQFTLDLVEKQIARAHPVRNVSSDWLHQVLFGRDSSQVVLFDVREEKEYNMSHLPGAIRISPHMDIQNFLEKYRPELRSHQAVFYCSVGKRSSEFLERLLEADTTLSADSLANLQGGIFRWYNNRYPVVNDSGETDQIHPFNSFWGQLIKKR
ncbi:MAG: rhodanese-like domain-containing protein [Calditrichaeota bacterium]|nr:MAG: rhodanese-like domain-containing protein [Calditrichota bacterium]